jgi:hypothetical protein
VSRLLILTDAGPLPCTLRGRLIGMNKFPVDILADFLSFFSLSLLSLSIGVLSRE